MTNANLQTKEQPEVTREAFFTPRVDILETEGELKLFADVPGVKPEDADVRFENGELILHARCPGYPQDRSFVHAEYAKGDFYRTFSISDAIDTDKISAELKNGVLTVTLPKSEAVKPRRIAVQGQ